MALHNKRMIAFARHEYVLPKPVHISEVNKTIETALADIGLRLDLPREKAAEQLWVDADDTSVIIRWEETNTTVVRDDTCGQTLWRSNNVRPCTRKPHHMGQCV